MIQNPEILGKQLRQIVSAIVKGGCPSVEMTTQQEMMTTSLCNFVLSSVAKFEAGQKAHGGDIRNRNQLKDADEEVIDLFWYLESHRWPKDENGKINKFTGNCNI